MSYTKYKDKAGNKITIDLTGTLRGYNAEGGLLDKKSFETLAKRAGLKGKFIN